MLDARAHPATPGAGVLPNCGIRVKIGNQTSFAAAVLEPFEFAVANGFAAFEFFPDRGFSGGGWHECELDGETRRFIRQTASDRNLELTVHAPLAFDPLHGPEDGRLYSTIEFASAIGATLLNLHLDMSQGAERFVDALNPVLRLTAETGLRLALENTVLTGPDDFNQFFSALRQRSEFPSAHAGMTLDLGHANLCAATRNDTWRYLDRLAPHVPIIHLHLHENFGDRDSHLTLFTGPSRENATGVEGVLDRLAERDFSGCAILEQWPQPPSLLVDARDRLRRLLETRCARTNSPP
ncbi:MAG: sugar phosphate isomerase/epimerase [Verrucomicrobia bacterium]|nr:sugar phosphate isomerase/epimerase [Verrucomicrobiota bacterium]